MMLALAIMLVRTVELSGVTVTNFGKESKYCIILETLLNLSSIDECDFLK